MPNTATIKEVLDQFIKDVKTCDLIIGHNIAFDKERIIEELRRMKPETHRSGFHKLWHSMFPTKYSRTKHSLTRDEKTYCTLFGDGTCKKMKLEHKYVSYFGYSPENLHNSLYDVVVCLRVYMKENHDRDVYTENDDIRKMIDDITPVTCESDACTIMGGKTKRSKKGMRRTRKK